MHLLELEGTETLYHLPILVSYDEKAVNGQNVSDRHIEIRLKYSWSIILHLSTMYQISQDNDTFKAWFVKRGKLLRIFQLESKIYVSHDSTWLLILVNR